LIYKLLAWIQYTVSESKTNDQLRLKQASAASCWIGPKEFGAVVLELRYIIKISLSNYDVTTAVLAGCLSSLQTIVSDTMSGQERVNDDKRHGTTEVLHDVILNV